MKWEIRKLGELCNLMTGGTPSRSKPEYFRNGKIRWLVSGDIHKTEIYDCEGRITEEAMENSNAKILPINSVMIALNGQGKTRGTVALLRTRATCNQSLVSIYPKDVKKIIPEYIFCNLRGRYDEIRRITGDDGNDRRGLNMPLIRSIEIPLPPLTEQHRIVKILDDVFAAAARAKENVEKNLQNVRELLQSYLQSTFLNPGRDWEQNTLGEVLQKTETIDPNKTPNKVFTYIDVSSINKESLSIETVSQIQGKNAPSRARKLIRTNDIIFATVRPTLKRIAIIPEELNEQVCSTGYFVIRSKEQIQNKLIFYYLQTNIVNNTMESQQKGASYPAVTDADVRSLTIVYPKSIVEQKKIISQLETLSTEIKKLEAIYTQKLADLEELKKSVLKKAFSGEL